MAREGQLVNVILLNGHFSAVGLKLLAFQAKFFTCKFPIIIRLIHKVDELKIGMCQICS